MSENKKVVFTAVAINHIAKSLNYDRSDQHFFRGNSGSSKYCRKRFGKSSAGYGNILIGLIAKEFETGDIVRFTVEKVKRLDDEHKK